MKHPFKSWSIKNYRYDSLSKVKCIIYQLNMNLELYIGVPGNIATQWSDWDNYTGPRGHQPSASVTPVSPGDRRLGAVQVVSVGSPWCSVISQVSIEIFDVNSFPWFEGKFQMQKHFCTPTSLHIVTHSSTRVAFLIKTEVLSGFIWWSKITNWRYCIWNIQINNTAALCTIHYTDKPGRPWVR